MCQPALQLARQYEPPQRPAGALLQGLQVDNDNQELEQTTARRGCKIAGNFDPTAKVLQCAVYVEKYVTAQVGLVSG